MRLFLRGWMPDVDLDTGPRDALLRMDNGVLDELGCVASRLGSQPINAEPLDDEDVHSLYTITLNSVRQRMVGAGNTVYANGASIVGSVAGSDDIAFGSHLGQIFFARSTTKRKYDGSDVTNWGIAMTGDAPSAAVSTDDFKTFASFNSTESPAFVEVVGDGISFVNGFDGTVNGGMQVVQDAAAGYLIVTKTFVTPQDFTEYDSGAIASDSDIIEIYLNVDPAQVEFFTFLQVDIDLNGTTPFVSDYYTKTLVDDEENDIQAGWAVWGTERSTWTRVGSNNDLSWATVKAIRITYQNEVTSATIAFDQMRVRGGTQSPITGTVRYKYIYVNDTGTYFVKSAPSDVSNDLITTAQAATISIPVDTNRDTQADQIWLFRQGAGLDQFYRVATSDLPAGFSFTCEDELAMITAAFPLFDPMPQAVITSAFEAAHTWALGVAFQALVDSLTPRDRTTADSTFDATTIIDQMSDADALELNITLNDTIDVPPDNIIAIEGPYFDRMYVLTTTDLYPSQPLGPDMFSVDEVIHIADETETALWLKKAFDGLYVGTTKDIYRLSGTGNPLADGTLDLTLQPLNIDVPPISRAVASDNTFVVYLGADGWRQVAGQSGSVRLVGPTSLLYRGLTRHGVEPVNLSGRIRATIAHGQLVAITPEGDDDTESDVLYRHVLATDGQRWYRHLYPVSWRSVAREPDGTLIAGDNAGTVWTLDDVGRLDLEDGLPMTVWTTSDDLDAPLQRKVVHDARIVCTTGTADGTVNVHVDDSDDSDASFTASNESFQPLTVDLDLDAVRRVQLRFTVTADEFGTRLQGYDIGATVLPRPFVGRFDNTNLSVPSDKTITGFTLRLCTLAEARTFSVIVDGETVDTFTITTGVNQPETHTAALETALVGTDWALSVDGDIELYSWEPIITTAAPRGVKTYDSGPMDLGQEFAWVRELRVHVNASAAITATLWFDGIVRDTVTLPVAVAGPRVITIPVPRDYKGSSPRLVLTSTAAFYPEWIDVVCRTSGNTLHAKPIRISTKAAA